MFESPANTYSDTTPHKRQITDAINLIDPADTPAIEKLGGLDGAASKFSFVNEKHTKMEWLEDSLSPLTDQLNGAIANGTDTAVIVDDASKFQVGHIILVESEQMWVSAVNTSTETITVTRAYSGTGVTHADDTAIEIVGMARVEGATSTPISFTDRTAGFNYTQIFHKEIEVTESQNILAQYGIASEFDYQANKAVPELGRLIEKQLFRGVRKAGTDTTPRAFGGFGVFITDNVISAGGTLTQPHFENAVKAAYEDGGYGPFLAFCSPDNMQTIKGFYDSSSYLRVERQENTVGMVIERIVTPFGAVDLVMDRWALDSEIYIVDAKNAGFFTYRPFFQEPLAKTGDSILGQVVGEFSFCLRQDKAHAKIDTIS